MVRCARNYHRATKLRILGPVAANEAWALFASSQHRVVETSLVQLPDATPARVPYTGSSRQRSQGDDVRRERPIRLTFGMQLTPDNPQRNSGLHRAAV